MKIKELLKDLKEKKDYKKFKSENPDSYFCSAMIILGEADKIDLNFFIPSKEKLSSFAMPFGSCTNHKEKAKNQSEIKNLNLKIDLDNLKEYIKEKTKKDYSKIIAIFYSGIWNLTYLNGLDINQIKINAYTGEIKDKKEDSFHDIIQIKKA